MRLPVLVAALIIVSPAHASSLPTDVLVTDTSSIQRYEGTASNRDNTTFLIKSSGARTITFQLAGSNDNCGVEMRTTSQLGYLPAFGRLPLDRSFRAKDGETFTLTFYQNRVASMSGTDCAFSFTVE